MAPRLPIVPVDTSLVVGFRYACRPGCGLCCYAEPLVPPADRLPLLRRVPEIHLVARGRDEFLAARPEGGACQLLAGNRCRAHPVRPAPCRQFPIAAHLGGRLQATVVLSCPGVDLAGLGAYRGPASGEPPPDFDEELAALRGRIDAGTPRRLAEGLRRRDRLRREFARDGRWEEEEEVRARFRRAIPDAGPEEFPAEAPPARADGLEHLPLSFDGRDGPVAWAAGLGGWELWELRPDGGTVGPVGVASPPTRPPPLSDAGRRSLQGYLRYWLDRDLLFGVVHLAMLEGSDGTVGAWVEAELRSIAALVLSRASVRATIQRGSVDRLTDDDVLAGIRATDQDLLDRPTWGSPL